MTTMTVNVDTAAAAAAAAAAEALAASLAALVKADGKASTTAFDYMGNAMRSLVTADNAEEEAQSLIVAICDATGSRGKVTAEFPKGKANANAIKANGYAMTAECARLIKKIGSTYADNEAVRDVVDGTLGLVRNEALFQQALASDKRYVAAKADFDVADSGDDVEALDKAQAALNRAIAKVEADFLNSVYGDKRCHSFAELRRQLDKATASKAETTSDNADTADKGEGEGVDVSAAAAVIGADDMAQSLISRVADVSDDVLVALFDAVKADMERRCATEEERKAA